MRIKKQLTPETLKMHDKIVRSVVDRLQREGYIVRVNNDYHPNGRPNSCGGFTPDIQAIKNFHQILIEVETCTNNHSKDLIKWKRFSSNGENQFWLIVPGNCLESFKQKKESFNIPMSLYCSNGNGKLEFIS
ncbi:hypothetical protein [Methanobacterium alcaliphilum]|uniref:hypothetical protein n=1 Tax=Methanobacterium alcaliphilum TaxID=392018 RepID=UPI00200AABE3|nr:hypothetical protein [Methanobacterium alcaliphilum]MCK9151566.1 hypothetical protein [Methanobacterium alcaliphilum]